SGNLKNRLMQIVHCLLLKRCSNSQERSLRRNLCAQCYNHHRQRFCVMSLNDLCYKICSVQPVGQEELDEGSVRDRYLVGMLAPRDQQIVPEEMDELAIPEEGSSEDGPNDDTALQTASLCPSSLGMSFCVDGAVSQLRVTARWGYYRR